MRYYLENYGTDERVTNILDTTEVWLVIVATDDTLLFGFGFEGISTTAERNEVMARSLQHLGLG